MTEIQTLVREFEHETEVWFSGLPAEIQTVYTTDGQKLVTQVPVLVELVRRAGHKGSTQWWSDLTRGFPMTGPMAPGTGWLPRTDERYTRPMCMPDFEKANRNYMLTKINTATPSPHWKPMLEELLADRAKGRVEGPLQAPSEWGVLFKPVQGMELSPAPTQKAFAAVCFAVVQMGKIRRCEDFRRSRHNETVTAEDSPAYTDVEQYIGLVQRLKEMNKGRPAIWLQDLEEGACRQVPVEPGADSYTVLVMPDGPTLWRHKSAPFGAAASVWAFCRFADGMVSVGKGESCAYLTDTSWTISLEQSSRPQQTALVAPSVTCSRNWDCA